ncbi:class I SAM-dependent methyltransferase [Ochrobactrum sp. S1502_03]|uniref:class I SAM-dependent methyltransferase n=1 Tax=Ochrobactrum sp. S1502_03 TaxID=3108451 RepID=UPI0037CAF007
MRASSPSVAEAMSEHWNTRAHRFNGAASHVRLEDDWTNIFSHVIGADALDVVDLGCGTGACSLLLAKLGHRVTGVDGSREMLRLATETANDKELDIWFIQSTMDEAPLADESADIVTLRNVLWTLENPAGAIALAHRILRPGGKIVVSDGVWFEHRENNSYELFGAKLPFYNGVTEDNALKLLSLAGFAQTKSWQDHFPQHPYGPVYDDDTQLIKFFVLSAIKPE